MGSEYRELILGEDFGDLLREPESVQAAEPAGIESLGGELIANLERQRAVYAEYHQAALRQKDALIHGRLAENQDANRDAEKALSLLSGLEAERLGISERILAARPGLAASAASLRCEDLYGALEPHSADRLRASRAALRAGIGELQRVLSVNAAMVENGSRIIQATIGIITSVAGRTRADKMSTYTRKGGVRVGKVQIRNLVNRSV